MDALAQSLPIKGAGRSGNNRSADTTISKGAAKMIAPRLLPKKCFYAYCEAEARIWVVIPALLECKENCDGTTIPDFTSVDPGPAPEIFQIHDEWRDRFFFRLESKLRTDFAYRFHAERIEAEQYVQERQIDRFLRWYE